MSANDNTPAKGESVDGAAAVDQRVLSEIVTSHLDATADQLLRASCGDEFDADEVLEEIEEVQATLKVVARMLPSEDCEEDAGWTWYCRSCEEELTRGDDAIACDDREECPCTVDWDGDACGYIVCKYCHRPASEVRE